MMLWDTGPGQTRPLVSTPPVRLPFILTVPRPHLIQREAWIQARVPTGVGLVQKGLHAARLCFSPSSPTTSSSHAADPDLAWQKPESCPSCPAARVRAGSTEHCPPRADSKHTSSPFTRSSSFFTCSSSWDSWQPAGCAAQAASPQPETAPGCSSLR